MTRLIALVLVGCGGTAKVAVAPDGQVLAPQTLARCPDSPNCVSSLADPADEEHFIEPLALGGRSEEEAKAALVGILEATPRLEVEETRELWIHATATSKVFRFVDDLELLIEPQTDRVEVRSASRMGYGDMGVNRARVEALREAWLALPPAS